MRNRFWSGACLVSLLVLGTGCSSTPPDDAGDRIVPTDNPAADQDQAGGSVINVPVQVIWNDGSSQDIRRRDSGMIPSLPDTGVAQPSEDDLPNGIMLATCETEPDEAALPLNAFDDRYCDTVQAIAYRSDDTGSYAVSADYFWSVTDGSVATIVPLPGQEHAGTQRPTALYDIFSYPGLTNEPATMLQVCAQPKGGWPWPQNAPLCRSIRLKDVVNLEGAWCFSGQTFGTSCEVLSIKQDGRDLTVETDGTGVVTEKLVDFFLGPYEYRGLLSSVSEMDGIMMDDNGDEDPCGSWSAWRLPLP